MKKSLITFLLALGMCFSLTACNQFGELFKPTTSDSSASNSSLEESDPNDSSSSGSVEEQKQQVTVTFKQSGCDDIIKILEKGESLTDIPDPQAKTGYTVVWDKTSFTSITEDIVVNAVATANKYMVTYDANGGAVANETQEVTYDEETTLVTPTRDDYLFNGWTYEGAAVVNGEAWTIANDVTLVAEWIDNRPTYTVTFVDGTQLTEVEVKKGEDLSTEDVPAFIGKTGYSVAWDITDYTNILTDMTVTAEYTANTYTITYDADGFAMDGTTVQLTYDALCDALDMTLTKEDANFLGWKYGEATYTNESVWNVADNVTVTPDWEAKDQVTIVFTDTDGSTINKTIYAGQDLTDIPTPKAKVGYTVESVWYTDEACTQTAVFTNVQAGFTVYAKATANTYKVSYDANGGTMSELTQEIAFDSEYTLATPTHEKTYMRFDGWETELGSILAQTGKWTMTENISVTAKWTDARAIYTISFVQAGQETKTFEVKEGESFTNIPTPVAKTGYTVEWDTQDFTKIAGNMTVTAVETANTYKVSYDANGGTMSELTQEIAFDSEYTLATPTHEKTYMRFDGWETESGSILAQTGKWTMTENISVTAKWTDARAIYTISFVQAGQETKTFEVKEGESFTNIPTPVAKTGYTVEWDTTDFTVVAGDMTVTAVETAKTYTITLNANGGKVSNTKITVIYGETYELPTPMHDDKAFVCWMYNGKKIAMTGIWSLDIDESIVFVVQWGKSEWTENY